MNPAIRSIVRTGVNLGIDVVGIQNGYQGIFDKEFMPLGVIEVSGRIRDAGTILSTSRCLHFKEEKSQIEAIQILKKKISKRYSFSGGRVTRRCRRPVQTRVSCSGSTLLDR